MAYKVLIVDDSLPMRSVVKKTIYPGRGQKQIKPYNGRNGKWRRKP
jgi:hypothetical protein